MEKVFGRCQIKLAAGCFEFSDIGDPNGIRPVYLEFLIKNVGRFGKTVIGIGDAMSKWFFPDAVQLICLLQLIYPVSAASVSGIPNIFPNLIQADHPLGFSVAGTHDARDFLCFLFALAGFFNHPFIVTASRHS